MVRSILTDIADVMPSKKRSRKFVSCRLQTVLATVGAAFAMCMALPLSAAVLVWAGDNGAD